MRITSVVKPVCLCGVGSKFMKLALMLILTFGCSSRHGRTLLASPMTLQAENSTQEADLLCLARFVPVGESRVEVRLTAKESIRVPSTTPACWYTENTLGRPEPGPYHVHIGNPADYPVQHPCEVEFDEMSPGESRSWVLQYPQPHKALGLVCSVDLDGEYVRARSSLRPE